MEQELYVLIFQINVHLDIKTMEEELFVLVKVTLVIQAIRIMDS